MYNHMKKADNFNPAKWLVENKITFQSRLNEIKIKGKTVKTYTQNGDSSFAVTYEDDTKERIAVSDPINWDILHDADLNEIEYMPDTDYEDNWEKGGGMDDEEFDFFSAKIVDKPFPDAKGNDRMIPTLVVDETGDEFQEFYILNTPEDEENLKNDQENGREIEGVFKVKMDNGEIKTAVVYPPTSSKSEFYGKFNEGDLKKYKGLNAALALINENEKKIYGIEKNGSPYEFGPYTYEEAKYRCEDYSEDDGGFYQPRLYNDMRDELPSIERMYTPRMDKDGNLEDVDSTPFNQGDLADY
jgi:hypothetical protein